MLKKYIMVKDIVDEVFQDYKKTSMFIGTCYCNWKCALELGIGIEMCQNSVLAQKENKKVKIEDVYNRYISNPLTSAIIIGGLEPMLQFKEIKSLISMFRKNGCNDDFVIYTGYYPDEIKPYIRELKEFDNIVVKYGRYIPEQQSIYDEVLGVTLASNNQFAERIS